FVVTHRLAYAGDLILDDVARRPQGTAGADLDHETAQQGLALARVGDLGMELHAIPAPGLIGHGRHRDAVGARGDDEPWRRRLHVVAMTHPHIEARRHAGVIVEALQQGIRLHDLDFGAAELARIGRRRGAAELARQRLHAIADPEYRHAR